MEGAVVSSANYTPLTPISFLERSSLVYADRTSIVHGRTSYTWRQTRDRCLMLASALTQLGLDRHNVVAVLAPNIPAMYELHFAVPMAGGVLCTLNTRHDASLVSHLLNHSESKVLFVDHELLHTAREALNLLSKNNFKTPLLVVINQYDNESSDIESTSADFPKELDYESLMQTGSMQFEIKWPKDELEPISLNYTSGTTSRPKGVIYTHRGAYLNSIAAVLLNDMTTMPVYLWTVPLFHCNGWCLSWAIAAQGGTNICLRKVTAKDIFDKIALHKVTYMGGAPTVLNMIINAPVHERKPLPGKVVVMTGGAPPAPHIISTSEQLGFHLTHAYGLTETYGPGTICTWMPEWNELCLEERAKLKARQGLQHLGLELDVKDPVTMKSVPFDGKTMGEVMFRGNTVMAGYYKDVNATSEALAGGWFRSGDLGVRHSDGYVQLKDRSKDIIISGGENISTIEVEGVIYSHPSVLEAAVVGRPDNYWGETPCAFVKLKEGHDATGEEIIQFCRGKLPLYMAPRTIVFEQELPKTSTGKIQKFLLRAKAKAMGSLSGPGRSKM
ncbi:4-coumarate:CoA ligase-like protein [Rhynchospora pubera]|uniref:4-coumarate--CoA ligase n=1 Tax=Rhynchospora pubera TaxID=906938 RepID=A0AAV8DWN9_9POAL|nr:4-coumarate:CoA ligase-like protein [Rhynchospora pubera]